MKGAENQRGNVRLKGWSSCMQVCESSRDRVIAFPSSATLFLFSFHLPPSRSLRDLCVFSPLARSLARSRAVSLFLIPCFYFFFANVSSLHSSRHCRVSLVLFLTRPPSPLLQPPPPFSSKRFLDARFAFRGGAPPVT